MHAHRSTPNSAKKSFVTYLSKFGHLLTLLHRPRQLIGAAESADRNLDLAADARFPLAEAGKDGAEVIVSTGPDENGLPSVPGLEQVGASTQPKTFRSLPLPPALQPRHLDVADLQALSPQLQRLHDPAEQVGGDTEDNGRLELPRHQRRCV